MQDFASPPDELRTLSLLLAHDLRNILSVLNNLVILLEHKPEGKYISMMKAQLDLCEQTVEHFVRYTQDGVVRGPVLLARLVRQVAGVAALPENLELDVRAEFEGEVIADPQQIRQVLFNLLMNAASACGDRPSKIRIGVFEEPGFARVDVEDTGPGLPESLRADLLVRPVRSGNTGGLGLGLSLCRRIVEAGGGRMDFESNSGSGSRFSVWLPLPRAANG